MEYHCVWNVKLSKKAIVLSLIFFVNIACLNKYFAIYKASISLSTYQCIVTNSTILTDNLFVNLWFYKQDCTQ